MTKAEIKKRLRAAIASGEMDRRYAEARKESAKLRADLEASKHIDPAILDLRMTW